MPRAAATFEAVAADEVRAACPSGCGSAACRSRRAARRRACAACPTRSFTSPVTPGPITCSQKLWPTWPLELPMPFGCSADFESSSRRADSSVDAASTTTLRLGRVVLAASRVSMKCDARWPCPSAGSTVHLARGGIGAHRQVAGVRAPDRSVRSANRRPRECRSRPCAVAGAAAEAAAAILVVLQAIGRDAGAILASARAAHLLERVAQLDLGAIQLGRAAGICCRADAADFP